MGTEIERAVKQKERSVKERRCRRRRSGAGPTLPRIGVTDFISRKMRRRKSLQRQDKVSRRQRNRTNDTGWN